MYLIYVHKYLKGGSREDGVRPFPAVPRSRTRGYGYKLKHMKFLLKSKEILFYCALATGCPQMLWCLHSWKYSKAIWIWSWEGGWTVPSFPNIYSITPLLYAFQTNKEHGSNFATFCLIAKQQHTFRKNCCLLF